MLDLTWYLLVTTITRSLGSIIRIGTFLSNDKPFDVQERPPVSKTLYLSTFPWSKVEIMELGDTNLKNIGPDLTLKIFGTCDFSNIIVGVHIKYFRSFLLNEKVLQYFETYDFTFTEVKM